MSTHENRNALYQIARFFALSQTHEVLIIYFLEIKLKWLFSNFYARWNHHKSFEHRVAAPLTFWVPWIFQTWNQNFIMKYWPSDAIYGIHFARFARTLIMTQIDSHLCVAKKSVRGHCTLGNVWYSLSKIGMKWDSQKKRTFLTLCDIIIIWWQKTECVPQIVLYRREVVTLFRSVFLLNKQPCRTLRQQKNLGFFFRHNSSELAIKEKSVTLRQK